MRRLLAATSAAFVLLTTSVDAVGGSYHSVVLQPGETYRIALCYLPNGKDAGFATGKSYGTVPLELVGYWPAGGSSSGWSAQWHLNGDDGRGDWDAEDSSWWTYEGPPELGWKTLAHNTGTRTVVFSWYSTSCTYP